MAIWQCHLHIVPEKRAEDILNIPSPGLDREQFSEIDWWEFERLESETAAKTINKILLARNAGLLQYDSWSKSLLAWGSDDSNQISLWREENMVDDISIRIDLSDFTAEIIESVVAIVTEFRGCLLSENYGRVENNEQALLEHLRNSRAHDFVHSPREFFEKLHANPLSKKEGKGNPKLN